MNEINESWYSIAGWGKPGYSTMDKSEVRLALREGCEVLKVTRRVFRTGDTDVFLTTMTEIKKSKDI